jgi:hypothetical protein
LIQSFKPHHSGTTSRAACLPGVVGACSQPLPPFENETACAAPAGLPGGATAEAVGADVDVAAGEDEAVDTDEAVGTCGAGGEPPQATQKRPAAIKRSTDRATIMRGSLPQIASKTDAPPAPARRG